MLFFFLLAFRLAYVAFSPLQLSPEEAYYWNYSQHPDLSYYDHPPMVAWIIYVFTGIFGHNEFGVRVGAVILSLGLTYLVYLIGKELYDSKTGLYSALLINLGMVFMVYSTGITPDSPLFFFWALSTYVFLKAVRSQPKGCWLLLGVALGCAYLSKYTAVFLPVSFGLFLLICRSGWKKWRGFLFSVVISAALFSPVIIWNFRTNFASFLFQTSNRLNPGGGLSFSIPEFLRALMMQAIFMSPFIFIAMLFVLVLSSVRLIKKDTEYFFEDKFLLTMTLPTVLFFYGVAFFTWVKLNWPTPAYITALILLARYYPDVIRRSKKIGKKFALGYAYFAVGFALLMGIIVYIQPIYPEILPELSRANTMYGWKKMSQKAIKIRETMSDPEKTFPVGHGYQIASELQFYGFVDEEVYSSNVLGETALAFDFWQNPEKMKGRDAVVVAGDFVEFSPDRLREHFEKVQQEEPLKIEIAGVELRTFRYYRCYNYLGPGR